MTSLHDFYIPCRIFRVLSKLLVRFSTVHLVGVYQTVWQNLIIFISLALNNFTQNLWIVNANFLLDSDSTGPELKVSDSDSSSVDSDLDLNLVYSVHGARCMCAETVVVQAPAEDVPAITITAEEHISAEDKKKGVFGQLKELLESDKQQQVPHYSLSRLVIRPLDDNWDILYFLAVLCLFFTGPRIFQTAQRRPVKIYKTSILGQGVKIKCFAHPFTNLTGGETL